MDIKISLEIGLSPALEGFLTKMLGGDARPTRAVAAPAVVASTSSASAAPVSDATPETAHGESQGSTAEDPQPEAQRRTRRTKAQIEADEAAAKGTAQPADQGGTPGNGTADLSIIGTIATNAASPSDLAAALEAAEPEARAGVTAKADVAAKMQEAMAATSPKKVQDRMADSLGGAKRLSEIDPANYASAIELFDDIIAGR